MKYIYKIYGWIVIRPIRYLFGSMVGCGSFGVRWIPRRHEYWDFWQFPNIHWWLLYRTVFKFFLWVDYSAWRHFCDWKGGRRNTFPLMARVIKRIGETTAGYAVHCMQCYHCGSPDGCQVELSQDETGEQFRLIKSWTVGTQEGTDHRFHGITICPKCGYEDEYEDGSL